MTLKVGDRITTRFGGPDSRAYIYHLVDPRDESICYVGSTNDPYKRYSAHISEALKLSCRGLIATNKKSIWIRELDELGLEPVLVIVGTCEREEATIEEIAEYYRQADAGAVLLNRSVPCRNTSYARAPQ